MMTRVKSQFVPRICSCIPLALWHRLVEVELLVPHWHVASDEDLPHISGLYQFRTLRQFNTDIEFFLKFYKPVSLDDVILHLDGVRKLPKRCFLPTFDDGFREVHDLIAPVLYRQGVNAIFFVITSAIDNHELCYPQKKSLLLHTLRKLRGSAAENEVSRRLTLAGITGPDTPLRIRSIYSRQKQVLDELGLILRCDFTAYVHSVKPYLKSSQITDLMSRGFAIGAHSVDHPLYSELNLDEQLAQTRQSVSWLSQRFQFECRSFAFPYQDAGVSPDFFPQLFSGGSLKVSFGIGGLRPRFFRRNLPRFSMERTDLPAAHILARQFGRALRSCP